MYAIRSYYELQQDLHAWRNRTAALAARADDYEGMTEELTPDGNPDATRYAERVRNNSV